MPSKSLWDWLVIGRLTLCAGTLSLQRIGECLSTIQASYIYFDNLAVRPIDFKGVGKRIIISFDVLNVCQIDGIYH